MSTNERIEEVLKVVREQGERSEARDHELFRMIQEHREVLIEERMLNNSRFNQLSAGLDDVRKDVKDLKVGLATVDAKIDRVYASLSQDIQIFAEDLHQVKRRVTRLEKKPLSP